MARQTTLTKDRYIAEYQSGLNQAEICEKYNAPERTVTAWRKTDPAFKARLDLICQARKSKEKQEGLGWLKDIYKGDPTDPFAMRKQAFLEHFCLFYEVVPACDSASVTVGQVQRWLDPESNQFDGEFSLAYKEIELRHALEQEDAMRVKGVINKDTTALKFNLPNLPVVGDKYAKDAPQHTAFQVIFDPTAIEKGLNLLRKLKERHIKEIEART